jgi:hypothetical protein
MLPLSATSPSSPDATGEPTPAPVETVTVTVTPEPAPASTLDPQLLDVLATTGLSDERWSVVLLVAALVLLAAGFLVGRRL